MKDIIQLRQKLHQNPNLSHQEQGTQNILKDHLSQFNPKYISLADGKAFLALFESKLPGPKIYFRADLDALPISSKSENLAYESIHKNISHKCGHDGHMALVASIANHWNTMADNQKIGTLGLLFQHAEETGEGAQQIMNDVVFLKHLPDYIYGFHNLPNVAKNTLVYTSDVFACASMGLKFSFQGKTSHASEPHLAKSPVSILQKLIEISADLNEPTYSSEFFISTLVYMSLGELNFGITPGDASMAFTLRSKQDSLLKKNQELLCETATSMAKALELALEVEICEPFPATYSTPDALKFVKRAASNSNLTLLEKNFPFPWSEDFGHYTQNISGAYFGLGIGKERPELHSPFYNFNDDVIENYSLFLKNLYLQHILP